jgi:hypothetical protein
VANGGTNHAAIISSTDVRWGFTMDGICAAGSGQSAAGSANGGSRSERQVRTYLHFRTLILVPSIYWECKSGQTSYPRVGSCGDGGFDKSGSLQISNPLEHRGSNMDDTIRQAVLHAIALYRLGLAATFASSISVVMWTLARSRRGIAENTTKNPQIQ